MRGRGRRPLVTPASRIRDARAEDAEALHALYHAAYGADEDADRPPQVALRDSLDDVRASIAEGIVLVAEDPSGALVGSVMLRRVANLRRLAVSPEAKRRGLGGELLEAALSRAKDEGMSVAMLDTIPTHPWLPDFYRAHGFEERCVETYPSGVEWLQLRRALR